MILSACHWWIVALWAAFAIYWTVAAIVGRRGAGRAASRRGPGMWKFHAALVVTIILILVAADRSQSLRDLQAQSFRNPLLALAGVVIATSGAGLAFTARAAIGRYWGTPATRRLDTDLVTTGPYRLVRHPIYSGMVLMMIGSAIGLSPVWLPIAIVAGIYFLFSARAEEKFMTERFPDSYPAYRARTKMLLPFLL